MTTILEDPVLFGRVRRKVGKEDRILISPANAEKKTMEVIELKRALPVNDRKIWRQQKNSIPVKQLSARRWMPWPINYEGKTSLSCC